MLDIANYTLDGGKLRVRLRCTCGGRRILKHMEGNEVIYECAACKSKRSMRELKDEATTYWRGRVWEIECEESKKQVTSIVANYAATLEAKSHRYADPYCTLHGHCVELGPHGLLFRAQNFQKSHFAAMSTDHRFASILFLRPIHGLLHALRGSIVEIKFRDDELPVCHIRVAFEDFSPEETKTIASHIESLLGRVTEWSLE